MDLLLTQAGNPDPVFIGIGIFLGLGDTDLLHIFSQVHLPVRSDDPSFVKNDATYLDRWNAGINFAGFLQEFHFIPALFGKRLQGFKCFFNTCDFDPDLIRISRRPISGLS